MAKVIIDFEDYQIMAQRTANPDLEEKRRLSIAGLGITGEAGEVADIIKKYVGHSHPLEKEKLVKELGDVLWYITEIAATIGVQLEDIAFQNIMKLKARYPDGFSPERSINRVE